MQMVYAYRIQVLNSTSKSIRVDIGEYGPRGSACLQKPREFTVPSRSNKVVDTGSCCLHVTNLEGAPIKLFLEGSNTPMIAYSKPTAIGSKVSCKPITIAISEAYGRYTILAR